GSRWAGEEYPSIQFAGIRAEFWRSNRIIRQGRTRAFDKAIPGVEENALLINLVDVYAYGKMTAPALPVNLHDDRGVVFGICVKVIPHHFSIKRIIALDALFSQHKGQVLHIRATRFGETAWVLLRDFADPRFDIADDALLVIDLRHGNRCRTA